MERNYNVGRASVELEAIIPVAVKPNIATIGGFSVKDKKTGKSIVFDWETSYGGANIDPDDCENKETLKLEWDLRNFDYGFFEEQSNQYEGFPKDDVYISKERLEELITMDEKDELEKFLTECEIEEVYYECYLGIDEEVHIPMKVNSFSIGEYEFSKEQIDKYNEKIIEEEKDYFLEDIERWFNI